MRISSALLIVASVGATFMVGAWDNLNSIDRSSTQGRQTLAQVVGASRGPPGFPFTFDNGWRPRLVEQTTLLHLKWIDRNGQVRHRRHVAVTDDFARRVLLGNKIQMPEIQILVIDEGNAVPVALADIVGRRAALERFFLFGKLPTIAALGGFAVLVLATARQRHRAAQGSYAARPSSSPDRDIPFKLAICAAMFVYVGWLSGLSAWSNYSNSLALEARGLTTDAQVLDSYAGSTAASVSISCSLVLGWQDLSGNERKAVLREIDWELYRKIRWAALRENPVPPRRRIGATGYHWRLSRLTSSTECIGLVWATLLRPTCAGEGSTCRRRCRGRLRRQSRKRQPGPVIVTVHGTSAADPADDGVVTTVADHLVTIWQGRSS